MGTNNLPFLDIKIELYCNDIYTSIYRKNTFTGLLLNFNAVCPIQWKKGIILGMLSRT